MENTVAHPTAGLATERDDLYALVTRKVVPLLVLAYFFSFLDRVNIGFAKLQMATDLGLSETVYGVGAGIFFWGYLLVQIPGGLLVKRFGPRRVLPAILVIWGVISAGTFLIKTPSQFYAIRFLLGVAEGGFFPGVVFYFNQWFPSTRQGKIMAILFLAMPVGVLVGGPLSGAIMTMTHNYGGLQGWQWMFLIEGIPAVALGLILSFSLQEGVLSAPWLTTQQKDSLMSELSNERTTKRSSFTSALKESALYPLMLISLLHNIGNYGLIFWVPTLIKGLGIRDTLAISLLTAVPYGVACVVMVINAAHSQRTGERRLHCGLPILVGSIALALSTCVSASPVLAIVLLTVAVCGSLATLSMFWGLPGKLFAGTAAAGGIGLVNVAACVAGFIGPVIMGVLKDLTGQTGAGVLVLSITLLASGAIILALPKRLIGRG